MSAPIEGLWSQPVIVTASDGSLYAKSTRRATEWIAVDRDGKILCQPHPTIPGAAEAVLSCLAKIRGHLGTPS